MKTVRTCRACGCTDLHACTGGCYWVSLDLCSACAKKAGGERLPLSAAETVARDHDFLQVIVPAAAARQHMLKLSRRGIGRRAIGAATDISDTVLSEIRSGRKQQIRSRTERLILAVTPAVASDHAYISAARTHQRIAELLDEGYTEQFLAQRLGYSGRYLQFGDRITARNAYRVERLHKELTE